MDLLATLEADIASADTVAAKLSNPHQPHEDNIFILDFGCTVTSHCLPCLEDNEDDLFWSFIHPAC